VSDAANNADRHIFVVHTAPQTTYRTAIGRHSASVDNLYQRLTDNTWQADRGEMLTVKAAAAADPAMLADLTEHTTTPNHPPRH
jgi:hypothetical protein